MLSFILVDSSNEARQKVKKIINSVMITNDIEYEVKEFSNLTSELKDIINTNSFKIYILAIGLDSSVSGIDVGKVIRQNDWDSELIYLTNHDNMFEKVFRSVYKVFDFIEKFDSMEKRVEKDIRKIVTRKWDKSKYIYSNNRVNFEIFLDEILYIYRDTVERKLVVMTTNGYTHKLNKNINELLKELDGRFRQVHRSCIVNTDKVNLYNWAKGYFVLDNNDKVDLLSKKYRVES